jgi:hypothetical protein
VTANIDGTSATITLSIPSATGNYTVGVAVDNGWGWSSGSGTLMYSVVGSGGDSLSQYQVGASTVTMNFVNINATAFMAASGIDVAAAAAAAGFVPYNPYFQQSLAQ